MSRILSNRNLAVATAVLLAVVMMAVARGGARFLALPALVQFHLASMMLVMMLTVPMLTRPKGTPIRRAARSGYRPIRGGADLPARPGW